MKVISYSLWGDKPQYTIGAIRNADAASELFPDWKCLFYCFSSVPKEIIKQLESRPNVLTRMVGGEYDTADSRGMFHRFLPADEEGIDYMMARDTDSRLSLREKLAVQDWIDSGCDLHVIRDHPYHGVPIVGGMWGIRGGRLKGIAKATEEFSPTVDKGQDQQFLWKWVWEKVVRGEITCKAHDPFFQKSPFPEGATRGDSNNGVWFVGQVFDENDKYNSQSDVDMVMQ